MSPLQSLRSVNPAFLRKEGRVTSYTLSIKALRFSLESNSSQDFDDRPKETSKPNKQKMKHRIKKKRRFTEHNVRQMSFEIKNAFVFLQKVHQGESEKALAFFKQSK